MPAAMRPTVAAAVVALVACVAFVATQDEGGRAPASRPSTPRPTSDRPLVVLSGNEHGFIRPCGCSKPALGGVHRRAHAIAELKKTEPRLAAVSLGDFLAEANRQQEVKFEHFLQSLMAMEYSAFVPGAGEFKMGRRFVADARGLTPVPFVAANAGWNDEPPFEKSVKLAETGGVLIGLVGPLPPELGVVVHAGGRRLADRDGGRQGRGFRARRLQRTRRRPAEARCRRSRTMRASGRTSPSPGSPTRRSRLRRCSGCRSSRPARRGRASGSSGPGPSALYEELRLEEARPGLPVVEEILDGYRKAVREQESDEERREDRRRGGLRRRQEVRRVPPGRLREALDDARTSER